MTTTLEPDSAAGMAAAVRAHPRVLAIGARTKPRLSRVDADTVLLSTLRLRGMVEYEPSEFTFTALAGTPLRDIQAALDTHGQYLPFDPLLVDAGATLGGSVAAGLNGPGRFRYGGVRDFILAVQFVDGAGCLLRAGAKVVKNAAGFDLPKFFCGSLGRFGVLTEVSFKVFPRPPSALTLRVRCADLQVAADRLAQAAGSRWEPDALDFDAHGHALYLRLAGPTTALDALAEEVAHTWPGAERLDPQAADAQWRAWREWSHGQAMVKVPLTLGALATFDAQIQSILGARAYHLTAGGNLAYVRIEDLTRVERLDGALRELGLQGLVVRGETNSLWLGVHPKRAITDAVRRVLDPVERFSNGEGAVSKDM